MTATKTAIDLNADLGEGDPYDEALLAIVSSCNVACGGHAGDADSMASTLVLAIEHGVAAGAHPSYPDREGFGRRPRHSQGVALYDSLVEQVTSLFDVAAELGTALTHLKPHGALYNDAAADAALADIVARVTAETPSPLRLVGPPGSELEKSAAGHGLDFVAEGFVDRAYRDDGGLVERGTPGAVHTETARITAQAVTIVLERRVLTDEGRYIELPADTLCIHGDTPNADVLARAVRDALEERAVLIRAPAGGGR